LEESFNYVLDFSDMMKTERYQAAMHRKAPSSYQNPMQGL
jgi:hypothetical protein